MAKITISGLLGQLAKDILSEDPEREFGETVRAFRSHVRAGLDQEEENPFRLPPAAVDDEVADSVVEAEFVDADGHRVCGEDEGESDG